MDSATINDYWSIPLAKIIAKMFNSMFSMELNKHIKFHNMQDGFSPRFSAESVIINVKQADYRVTTRR